MNFSIKTFISQEEYVKLIFKKSFKSPVIGIIMLGGILSFISGILIFFKLIPGTFNDGLTPFIFGLIAIWIPVKIRISARKIYANNPRIRNEVEYSFNDETITVKGTGFESSFAWSNVVRVEEVDNFLFLYTSKIVAEIIKKDRLTSDQLSFIKSKALSNI